MNAVIVEKIRDFHEEGTPKTFERDLSLGALQTPAKGNLVNVVVGVRRCGKTFRLYQEINRILESGWPLQSILYFNFEDERLKPYSSELLTEVVDTYFSLYPETRKNGAFFFFDEIQEVPDWGTFLRRMVDTQKATIYVTGSSSKMLSSEIASEFRGRAISRELFPLSFSEYARFTTGMDTRQITDTERPQAFSSSQSAQLRHTCTEYLKRGGFMQPLSQAPAEAVQLLQEYAYRTVTLDVIERFGIGNPLVATHFVSRCLASSGRELSINKAHGAFRSAGIATSRETLSRLLSYYEEAYLVFPVRQFSRALADNPKSVSKLYAVDPGLFAAFSPAPTQDEGQRLETAVFDKLRRTSASPRTGSIARLLFTERNKKREVDFVVGDALMQVAYQLIQACTEITDENYDREVTSLEYAMTRFENASACIVTLEQEQAIETEQGIIEVVPAWKWLLD